MKKFLSFVLTLTIVFALSACGNSGSTESIFSAVPTSERESSTTPQEPPTTDESAPQSQPEAEAASASLVVYFSWSGNTESVANEIQAQTGADIFEITPAEPYTDDYNTLLDVAQEEQANEARPAIAGTVENFDQYDVVYLGYPNWWGDMPMILYSFFDEYDFSGKTIVPFNTHGGSGFSNTINTIAELEPGATTDREGFTVSRNTVQDAEPDIIAWLETSGYTK